MSTSDRRKSKTLLTIDKRGSEVARNCFFRRPMAIKNYVSNYFFSTFVDSIHISFQLVAAQTLQMFYFKFIHILHF